MNPKRPAIVAAHAKINLSLDILGRRPDGYHELDTVFQRLALHDTIVLWPWADGTLVECDRRDLPAGPANLAYRAAEILRREYGRAPGVRLRIRKRIPVAAGLGGGSADAAAVLRALPEFWRLPAPDDARLHALARELGADVPFCLAGVTARARGVGDVLERLPGFTGVDVLLVKPAERLLTERVYREYDLGADTRRVPMDEVVRAVAQKDLRALGRSAGNALEEAAARLVPAVGEIGRCLREAGAAVVLMSGSGPTVFGLHEEEGWARRAAERLSRPGWTVIATKTL